MCHTNIKQLTKRRCSEQHSAASIPNTRILQKKDRGLSGDFMYNQPTAGLTRPFPRRPSAHAAHAHSFFPVPLRPAGPALKSCTRTPHRRPHEGALARGLNVVELASPGARIPRQPGPVRRRSIARRPFSFGCRRRQGFRQVRRVPPHHRTRRTPEPRGAPSALAPILWGSPAAPSPRRPVGLGLFPPGAGGRERRTGKEAGTHMRRGRAPRRAKSRGSASDSWGWRRDAALGSDASLPNCKRKLVAVPTEHGFYQYSLQASTL